MAFSTSSRSEAAAISPHDYVYAYLPERLWPRRLDEVPALGGGESFFDQILGAITSYMTGGDDAETAKEVEAERGPPFRPSAAEPFSLMDLRWAAHNMRSLPAARRMPIEQFLETYMYTDSTSPVEWTIASYDALIEILDHVHARMGRYPYSMWRAMKLVRRELAKPVIKGGSKKNILSARQLLLQSRGAFVEVNHREPTIEEAGHMAREILKGGTNMPTLIITESLRTFIQVVLGHFLSIIIGARDPPPWPEPYEASTYERAHGDTAGGRSHYVYGAADDGDMATAAPAHYSGGAVQRKRSTPKMRLHLAGGRDTAPREWLTNRTIDSYLDYIFRHLNPTRFHWYRTDYCDCIDHFLQGIDKYPDDRHFIVVNTATSGTRGQHWIALGFDTGAFMHFDSNAARIQPPLTAALKPLICKITKIKLAAYQSQSSDSECGIYCLMVAVHYMLEQEVTILANVIPDTVCYDFRTQLYDAHLMRNN